MENASSPPWEGSSSQRYVLVTGANGGLGFSVCERLIDEFLSQPTRDPNSHLVLIIATRSSSKTRKTTIQLRLHTKEFIGSSAFGKELKQKAKEQGKTFQWTDIASRVHILGVELDLCDLRQVYSAARKIKGKDGGIGGPDMKIVDGKPIPLTLRNVAIPRIDVIVMNAGIGAWSDMNWPLAVWEMLTGTVQATTWPEYKIPIIGVTVRQTPEQRLSEDDQASQQLLDGYGRETDLDDAALGKVFCANLFGHYVLGHELMPLLNQTKGRPADEKGRIIWISSIEAVDQVLDPDDLQCIRAATPYEDTKRLTDILALTSDLPSVRAASRSFFSSSSKSIPQSHQTELYVAHPGICATNIVPLNWLLHFLMILAFYVSRIFFNSIWHPIYTYKGAVAPVWLALAEQQTLDEIGARRAKWGSATDRWGNEPARKTEVGGWGWSGVVGDGDKELWTRGRKPKVVDLTQEDREEFEVLGGRVWRDMEKLRREWEERFGGVRDNDGF